MAYLDFTSHGLLRRFGPLYWVRMLWSHRARLDVARHATAGQAMLLIAAISVIAAVLSRSHLILQLALGHLLAHGAAPMRFRADLIRMGLLAGRQALKIAPIYFGGLTAIATAASGACWLMRKKLRIVSHRLAAIAAAAVPILWFFILFQIEGLAPFLSDSDTWHGPWNPITNALRFALLMGALVLAAVWIVDIRRIYNAVRG